MKSGATPRRSGATRARRLTVLLFALIAVFAAAPAVALANTIQGTVTDVNTGNPLGGVTVKAYDQNTDPTVAVATTTSATNGTYTLTVTPGSFPATYYVGFSKTAYNPIFYNQRSTLSAADQVTLPTAAANPTGIDAQMTPTPGTITGHLKDAGSGNGVPGVQVTVYDSTGASFVAQGTTTADGSFSITAPNLTEGQYKVFFQASGTGDYSDIWYLSKPSPAQADLVTVHGGQTTTLQDQPITQLSGHIAGTVTDSGGHPLAGVAVEATGPGGGSSTVTAPDGTYTITGLSTGDYTVRFSPPPGQNLVANYYNNASGSNSATPVHVTNRQTTSGINSTLQPGGIVSGTITKAADGSAVSGATVEVLDASGNLVKTTVTAANGQYSINGLATSTYFVYAIPPDGSTLARQFYGGGADFGTAQPVNVTSGQTTGSINVALPNGGQITGRVTDSAGNPAAGTFVRLLNTSGYGVMGLAVVTAADGTYTIKQVPAGTFVVEAVPNSSTLARTYYVSAPDAAQATGVSVATGQTVGGINISLPAGAGLSGKVTLASSGAPIGGVSVTLLDSGGNAIAYTATDPDGTYKFTDMFPTAVKVLFSTETGLGFQYYNNATTFASATPVNLSPGQTASGINAALSPGGTVSGTVTDASSHALLPDIAVSLLDDQGNQAGPTGFTRPDGKFTLYGVAPGAYFVRFTDESGHRPPYRTQFLGGAVQQAGSNKITVTAGQTTSGVDAALVPQTAPAPGGTAPPPPPPPVVKPGPPTVKPTSLSGLKKGHPRLVFSLTGGPGGMAGDVASATGGARARVAATGGASARVASIVLRLPKGLVFKKQGLSRGLRVTGGTVAYLLSRNTLLIAFRQPTAAATVTLTDKLLGETKAFIKSVKNRRLKVVSFPIETYNASGSLFKFALTYKKFS